MDEKKALPFPDCVNVSERNATNITPEMAAKWLQENNVRNRPRSQYREAQIARDIVSGGFLLTGNCISFDWDNALIDGQTRLGACVLANRPIAAFVAIGLNPDAFRVTDRGRIRSMAQVTGYDRRIAMVVNSYLRLVYKVQGTSFDVVNLYNDKRENFDAIALEHVNEKAIGQAAVWVALVIYHQHSPKDAIAFMRELKGPIASGQVQVLKNYLYKMSGGRGGENPRAEIFGRALYCMNAHRWGKPITRALTLSVEEAFKV